MKTMTEGELDQWVEQMRPYIGAELRQFRFNEKSWQSQWSLGAKTVWLTFSLKPGTPYLFSTVERIPLVTNLKKPLSLFLKTHCLERVLTDVEREAEKGRVAVLHLSGGALIRMILVPGRVNLEVEVDSKRVYANKPSPLPESTGMGEVEVTRAPRSQDEFLENWIKSQKKSSPTEKKGGLSQDLKKKQQGLAKMEDHLEKLKSSVWEKLGEWLKTQADLDGVSQEWKEFVDFDQTLSWNIENCFSQFKKNTAKIAGTEQRIKELKLEIQGLASGEIKESKEKSSPSLLSQANLKGRTLHLPEGRFFMGKSGRENLEILRKAKAWYLWLHIKDYPGAYGILERNKGKSVSQESLQLAAKAVAQQSLPKGASGAFSVIYAECRYVRPIKGAKAGQVTYSHEKVMTVRVGE